MGLGFYPVRARPYDAAYWDKYRGYDQTPTGAALTQCRIELVKHYWSGRVVDIGIGGGRFMLEHGDAGGFDINPVAVEWLRQHEALVNPYTAPMDAACFWDSLEHIHDPAPILRNIRHWCFVSLPIFRDATHILMSKHFRPDEHCWYFTRKGLSIFMERFGFRLAERSTIEQKAGREDIETFAFRRN